ncbi:MAG TPA: acyl-CoA dehydrogenase family protein [Myxococcota bacterium]|nr:acyl-CoA dehydrogenase family protein [Myxococcota bacterium]HRY93258.1 acyl-CoA dehydrogenase family protein [Myxococcota bacterium]HSA19960.1 acyl-CoA dehydrogenase family protein [Myxococcota bacterium]
MQPEMQPEELEMILSTVGRFAERRLGEAALKALDHEERCPLELLRELLGPEIGLHLAFVPVAYGGLGGGARAVFRICEAVGRVDLGIATSLLGVALGSDPILVGGTEEQRVRWMGRVASEGMLVAYAVTEPGAGSDLGAIRTRAEPVREGERVVAYRLSGSKQFITNGAIADLYTVLAVAPGGPSFFVLERGAPGLVAGPAEVKHGIRASNTTSLTLDDVRVPAEQLLGGVEGQGLAQAQAVFGYTRVMVAAFGLAGGSAALERAVAYGRDRVADGSALIAKQAWTHKLIVPHAVALEAARAHIEALCDRLDAGEQELQVDGAVAKLMATEAGNAAAEAAIQAHGGYGYLRDYMVEKLKRDVRITCIYEGTSEILQRTVARDRWRLHLMSAGRHHARLAEELSALERAQPGCGAAQAADACRIVGETLEICRQARLTRHQHVLFALGLTLARVEVAAAFARKAARGLPDTSRLDAGCLQAMSRLWARRVAQQTADDALEIVFGADALQASALQEFEGRLQLPHVHAGLGGQLQDLDRVARTLAERA